MTSVASLMQSRDIVDSGCVFAMLGDCFAPSVETLPSAASSRHEQPGARDVDE
jgi:hypothetical protein